MNKRQIIVGIIFLMSLGKFLLGIWTTTWEIAYKFAWSGALLLVLSIVLFLCFVIDWSEGEEPK